MSQSYYEYEWDGSYCYADSEVLINKLGITDGSYCMKLSAESLH